MDVLPAPVVDLVPEAGTGGKMLTLLGRALPEVERLAYIL